MALSYWFAAGYGDGALLVAELTIGVHLRWRQSAEQHPDQSACTPMCHYTMLMHSS